MRIPRLETNWRLVPCRSHCPDTLPAIICLLFGLALVATTPLTLAAQRDSIDLVSGRPVRGTIQASTSEGLVVATEEGERVVPGWQIRRIRFDNEPTELTRARSSFADDRFNEVIASLDQITEAPDRPLIAADIEYMKAMASAKTALAGGAITANQATELLREFGRQHADHYMLPAALELYADLTFAQGNFGEATRMYERLAGGTWPEIAFEARIRQGRALTLEKKYDEAIAVFEGVEGVDSAEDYALQGKAVARCLKAQAMALAGKASEAESIALEVIKNADARNSNLLARAYNALGTSYLQQEKLKEAARAWLHTDLLFMTDPDAHAEALYQLSQVWPRLDREDRALETRQEIRDRYRNSFWATRVEGNRP